MKTVKFKKYNREFVRRNADKSTETVFFFTNGRSAVCCIKPTLIERIRILFGERVWLITNGSVPPVFDIQTENPFAIVNSGQVTKGDQTSKKSK
jgi:hypothetical protein